MLTNDELKKKIVDIIQSVKPCTNQAPCDICKYCKEIDSYTNMSCTTLRIADALIVAGLTFDDEWKHRTELAEKMYSMLRDFQVEKRRCGIPTGINCLVENEDCAKCMDIYYVIEAEQELQEERKINDETETGTD